MILSKNQWDRLWPDFTLQTDKLWVPSLQQTVNSTLNSVLPDPYWNTLSHHYLCVASCLHFCDLTKRKKKSDWFKPRPGLMGSWETSHAFPFFFFLFSPLLLPRPIKNSIVHCVSFIRLFLSKPFIPVFVSSSPLTAKFCSEDSNAVFLRSLSGFCL